MPNQPPNDSDALRTLFDAMQNATPINLEIEPFEAFTLIGLLQLNTRHPGLSANSNNVAIKIARQLQTLLTLATGSDDLHTLIEHGFNPRHDRNQHGQPIHPEPDLDFTTNLTPKDIDALVQILGGKTTDNTDQCQCPGCRHSRGDIPHLTDTDFDTLNDLTLKVIRCRCNHLALAALTMTAYAIGVDNARAEKSEINREVQQ